MRRTVNGHEVSTVSRGIDTRSEAYHAICSCGWIGPLRKVAAATEGDVERHVTRSAY
jgi:hypothetical protein